MNRREFLKGAATVGTVVATKVAAAKTWRDYEVADGKYWLHELSASPPVAMRSIRRSCDLAYCLYKDTYAIIRAESAFIRVVMLYQTRDEMLRALGMSMRAARLAANLSLETTAARSGISLTALRNLEGGRNASTVTLVQVCRTLKRTDWILGIAPPEVNDALFDQREPKKRLRATPRRGGVS